jgi:EAL and modified HD-GYP domain-containing signal transduction protein
MFQQTVRLGYSLFQGYFFAKPKVISRKAMPPQTLAGLEVMAAVSAPSMDLKQVERLLKRDISLVHRLLRYINSAFFGWHKEIASVKQALVLLGTDAVRKWVSLVVSVDLARDKPQALVSQAVIRARLCERLAELAPGFSGRSQELFLLGLFSFIDAIMDRPLRELVDELSLVADIREALLGGENSLRRLFDYAVAVENANWKAAADLARQLGLDESPVPELYLETVAWSRELEASMSG